MKHWERHPTYVEGCFGCKAATLVGVTYSGGRESFHENESVFAREKKMVAENTAKHGKDGFSRHDPNFVDKQLKRKA